MADHTPTPWIMEEIDPRSRRSVVDISSRSWGAFIQVVIRMEGKRKLNMEGVANAQHVIKACNAHKELVDLVMHAEHLWSFVASDISETPEQQKAASELMNRARAVLSEIRGG